MYFIALRYMMIIYFIRLIYCQRIAPTQVTSDSEVFILQNVTIHPNIICTKSYCEIRCHSIACDGLNINGSQSSNLHVLCLDEMSCVDINIISGGYTSTKINCSSSHYFPSCKDSQFNVANSELVYLYCDIQNTHSGQVLQSCYNVSLNAITSNNIYVMCKNYGCYNTTIHAEHVSNAITLNCDKGQSCKNVNIYCPMQGLCNVNNSATDIECFYINIFVDNDDSNTHLNCDTTKWDKYWHQNCVDMNSNVMPFGCDIYCMNYNQFVDDSIVTNAICDNLTIVATSVHIHKHNSQNKVLFVVIIIIGVIVFVVLSVVVWYCFFKKKANMLENKGKEKYEEVYEVNENENENNEMETIETVHKYEETNEDLIENEDLIKLQQWFKDNVDLNENDRIKYCHLFMENGYDIISSFRYIDKNELKMMGIVNNRHQKALLNAIHQ